MLLDFSPPPSSALPAGVEYVQGDVRDAATLARCFAGAAVVFHIASFGMSGRQQLQRRLIQEINVQGAWCWGPGGGAGRVCC